MPAARISEADFIRLFEEMGGASLAKHLNLTERAVLARRHDIENRIGRQITGPEHHSQTRHHVSHDARVHLQIYDGVVLIGSDAHYWPGIVSPAHRAFVKACKELKPKIVIMNGDVLDGATISRHAPIGWEDRPSLVEEIETCKERLGEIEDAAQGARRIWTLGNHDGRFETRLATVAPEYARVHGVHLKDHFPLWEPGWSAWINEEVVVKHRHRGGIHAVRNNTIVAGKTMVTGHLHSLKVTPLTDYNGTRWGVDTGTLATTNPVGPQFVDYLEDGPVDWRAGFAVLTFHKQRLLWPELCHVLSDTEVEFRGKVCEV